MDNQERNFADCPLHLFKCDCWLGLMDLSVYKWPDPRRSFASCWANEPHKLDHDHDHYDDSDAHRCIIRSTRITKTLDFRLKESDMRC